jgi:hypothetical protein
LTLVIGDLRFAIGDLRFSGEKWCGSFLAQKGAEKVKPV